MAFAGALRRTIRSFLGSKTPSPRPARGEGPAYRDTLSAINDLSRLVRNDPEAVDICLALGNLFRAQGDIERAVMIREGLIARSGLDTDFKARSYYELGQDYHRAGVIDRALAAFREAEALGYSAEAVTAGRADLLAQSGDFARASEEYGKLNHPLAQAHYLVRQAEGLCAENQEGKAEKLVKKALSLYPGSVEGWIARIRMAILSGNHLKGGVFLEKSLAHITPPLRFLVLDALLHAQNHLCPDADANTVFAADVCAMSIPVLETHEPDILLHYYGALLLLQAGDVDTADVWLAKALIVQPNFWAARLLALQLSVQRHELAPVVAVQVSCLAEELRHIRRFVCTVCGLRENQVFYRCRRCGSWHSLSFRLSLQE